MLGETPIGTTPVSSSLQMVQTHNGEIFYFTLYIKQTEEIELDIR